ncbi:DUF4328 domain-containing protein [Streptomyces sp. NPDC001530]|uniref:DUF4328 domain-containing protein n=1 Tax=Streptomyces sp. NPDC001530 TaxID=3364582 RepID=UPI0036B3EF1E
MTMSPPSQPSPPSPPSQSAPPFTSPHGTAWLRSPVGLGKATAVLLGVVIAADLFGIWADITMYDVTGALADGDIGEGVQRRADRADSLYSAAGYAQTITLVAAVVVYLIWFLRVRVNAEVFNPFGHSKARGWAGWGWFVPVVNLWFPRRVMLDIWDASTPTGTRGSHGLVNAWWTLWIVGLIANRAGFTEYRKAETALELHDATSKVMFADVVDIAAAVLAILVVLRLTRMQNETALRGPALMTSTPRHT